MKTVSTLESVQTELNVAGDETLVKFKSVIKLSQPLFEKIEFIAAAKASGFDASAYQTINKGMAALSANARNSLSELAKQATDMPTMLKEVAASGSNSDWYGSFRFKRVVDKWVASDFKTDIAPKFTGQIRSSFDVAAIESSQAPAWFSDIKVKQQSLLEKIITATQLDQKDAEIAAAKESAQVERDARERIITMQQQQARKMPINVGLRKAAVIGGYVLQLQSNQSITIRLDVVRAAQNHAREFNIVPGRTLEYGGLEGWSFRSGDQVVLSNRLFDPMSFSVP